MPQQFGNFEVGLHRIRQLIDLSGFIVKGLDKAVFDFMTERSKRRDNDGQDVRSARNALRSTSSVALVLPALVGI